LSDFSIVCVNSTHKAVHYDAHGYMRCDVDRKYVYADGRPLIFSNSEDRERYISTLERLGVIFGFRKSREEDAS
jgi:hypothetical protein